MAATHTPGEALSLWIERYVDFIAAKRGLAAAIHSADPAFSVLPAYFDKRLRPALAKLLEAAVAAGAVRADINPDDLLRAVATVSTSGRGSDPAQGRRMVALIVDGLRYGV